LIKAAYYATLPLYFYSFMFPGFPGGYNFILIMDIPCAGADNAPALFFFIGNCDIQRYKRGTRVYRTDAR